MRHDSASLSGSYDNPGRGKFFFLFFLWSCHGRDMYVWRGEVVEEAARWPSHPPSGRRCGQEPRPCGSGKRRGGIRPTSDSTAESLHFGACVIDSMVVCFPGRARVDLIIKSSPGDKVCREVKKKKKKKTAVIPVWPLQAEIRKNKTSGLDPPFAQPLLVL